MKVSGWGCYPVIDTNKKSLPYQLEVCGALLGCGGTGRSNGCYYGDSAHNRQYIMFIVKYIPEFMFRKMDRF